MYDKNVFRPLPPPKKSCSRPWYNIKQKYVYQVIFFSIMLKYNNFILYNLKNRIKAT